MTTHHEREDAVEPGLTYTEETSRIELGVPVRDCSLRQAGVAEPISGLNLLSFRQLLPLLEAELCRRLANADLHALHTTVFDALCRGDILPESRDLLRLLLGHWSLTDARAYGVVIPAQYERVLDAWFPGGGTQLLPQPYAHTLDRY